MRKCFLSILLLLCLAPMISRAQAVNDLLIQMLSYEYNCATGMATVKYHITNTDASGHTGGYNTSYSINLGVYSTSGYIANGDDDVEFTGGYIIGDIIECRAEGVGNNFTYPMTFRYQGYLPRPAKPYIFPFGSTITTCSGQPVTLYAHNATGNPASFLWSNGQTGASIDVSVPGTYTVQELGSCGNSDPSDPITVVINGASTPPVITSMNGLSLCNGGYTILSASSSGGTIHWSTGETGSSITVSTPGSYYAWEESSSCGNSANSNTITLTAINTTDVPVVQSSNGTLLCNGASTTLTATPAHGGTIYWNTGQIGNSITVSSAGSYSAYEGTPCGTSNYSNAVVITTLSTPAAPTIATNQGTLLCDGATATLFVPSPAGTITWNTGETGSSINKASAGSYSATQTNGCGTSANSNVINLSVLNTPAAPSISPVGPVNLCNGSSASLSTGVAGTFFWYRDGVYISTVGDFMTSTPGIYTATSANSCGTSPASNAVIITAGGSPPAPTVSSSGSIACNGGSVTLSTTPSAGGTIYWSNGATGNAITVSTAGSYYAYETNSCGNSGNSNAITITTGSTPPAPALNVSGSITLCDGAGQVLTTAPSAGGAIHWSNGLSGNAITVYDAGSYYAYETNGCGNGPGTTVDISTLSRPAAPVVTPPGSQLLCNGQTLNFNATGSNITWSNGATGNNMVTGVAGTYYAYDHNYCGNSVNSNAVVITTGNCPTPSPGTTFSICPGSLKTLDAGAGYDTYQWSNGATTRTIAVGPGNYAVTVSKNGCFATSVTVSVSYYSVTTPVINSSGATTFCAGSSVTLSSSTGSAYSWSNGSTSNAITVNTSGSYFVTVTDANGCQATSVPVSVTVNPLPTASIGGTTSVCKNSVSPSITFTGNGGTAPFTFSYNINGGSTQTITASGSSVSLAVPTATAGSFVYQLSGVQESSSTSCYNAVSGSATVTVNELPTATIAGSATVCLNSASPMIVFTGNMGTAPYTFTYNINGGEDQTVTTTSGNSVAVAVPSDIAGTFTYSLVSVQESSGLTCANPQSGSATVTVRPLPMATVSGTTAVCQNSLQPVITFTGNSGTAPYTFTYSIGGGSAQTVTTVTGNSVSVPVPTNLAGAFTYKLLGVAESGNACANIASGIATVTVKPLPLATIAGSTTVCQNAPAPVVSFTGSDATAPYTFTYRINGGANQTIATTSGNSVTLNAPTSVPGTYTYELLGVQESSRTSCSNQVSGSVTIVVRELPTATIAGSTTVCKNSSSPMVTFTGAGGNAPYTFTYKINGGADQLVTTSTGNSVSVEVPTTTAGTFVYSLVGVQESGSPSCMNAASGSATVIVNPLPTATIAGNTTVCQHAASPFVTFTGSDATAPYTFTYSINGGSPQTVNTTTGNSVMVSVPTGVPGTFTYSLISVQESSGVACSNTVSGSVQVIVNPQPAAAVILAPNSHLCNGEAGQLTIYNWTEGFTYRWYKDGVLFATATGQTMAVTQAGTYTVMVTSDLGCDAPVISNAVIITTGSISVPIITGSLKVCEGGKTRLLILPADKTMPYELYRWTDTPIGDSLGNGQSFSALAGQYRVRVEREGCYDSTLVIVTADDTEYPAGILEVTPDAVPYGGQVVITAEVTGAVAYQWDFGNDKKIVSAANTMMQNYFVRSDSVRIKVMAVSERNCKTQFTAFLKVGQPDSLVFTDHSFTGNLKDWNLFPLPFHNELKLSVILKHNETIRMDLFTAEGSWVKSWQFPGRKGENLFQLNNIESLPAGVLYFVTAIYNGEKHFDKIYKY